MPKKKRLEFLEMKKNGEEGGVGHGLQLPDGDVRGGGGPG